MQLRSASRLLCAALALAAACAHERKFVWIDDFAEDGTRPQYVLGTGDVIQVRVFQEEQLSTKSKVRPDGRVSLPLLGDVEAAGTTPAALAQVIVERLKGLVVSPSVTVSVEEPRPQTVLVLGEVVKPGVYPLEVGQGVLQGLVQAGGLTEVADSRGIFVIRRGPAPARVRFTWDKLLAPDAKASAFALRPGDVVVVE